MLSHLSQLGNNIQPESFSTSLGTTEVFSKNLFWIFIVAIENKLHCKSEAHERKDTYLEFKSQLAGRGIDPGVRGLGSMEFGR